MKLSLSGSGKRAVAALAMILTLCLAGALGAYAADNGVLVSGDLSGMRPISLEPAALLAGVENTGALDGIVVTALPDATAGVLQMNGRSLWRGEGVAVENLGRLRFMPTGLSEATITFTPVYADGKNGASVSYTISGRREANSAPIAQTLALETYRNIAIGGAFRGMDPDGDALTYRVVKEPGFGALRFDEGSAQFVYTPYQNKTGTDSFTYAAVDAYGAVSAETTVTVRVDKPQSSFTYADMSGHPAHFAAIRMAEEGVYTGAGVGGAYFLDPDASVTRGDFIAMAVALSGEEPMPAVNTSFADDPAIPVWVKPFAVTAVRAGLARGDMQNGERVLRADEPITRAEAAVILNNLAGLTDVATARVYSDEEAIPAWAKSAVSNVDTLEILGGYSDGSMNPDGGLTRAQALQALYNAMRHMEKSVVKTGLFSWIL